MDIHLLYSLLAIQICFVAGQFPVRISGVPSGETLQGRVEVFHNHEWGTICQNSQSSPSCQVACRQTGYSNGHSIATPNETSLTPKIWFRGSICDGNERYLSTCMQGFWGNIEGCNHNQDLTCLCQRSNSPIGTFTRPPTYIGRNGACDRSRYRIRAFDPEHPGIGRVEIMLPDNQWYIICNDFWYDQEAAVVCRCLGYNNPDSAFHAYRSSSPQSMFPVLPVSYDSVRCSTLDGTTGQDLLNCDTTPSSGRCDSTRDAAAVACEPLPMAKVPDPPRAMVNCTSEILDVCFTTEDYHLSLHLLNLMEVCHSSSKYTDSSAVCYQIDMSKCTPSSRSVSADYLHYCYDIGYNIPGVDTSAVALMTGAIWTRTACCKIHRQGRVQSDLQPGPLIANHGEILNNTAVTFTLNCYNDSSFTADSLIGGDSITAGRVASSVASILRGQQLYCSVEAHSNHPDMMLVTPRCQFTTGTAGWLPFTFISDRCVTHSALHVSSIDLGQHKWGFGFVTPMFRGSNQLNVQCDAYMCSPQLDDRTMCDRSCRNPQDTTRYRRSLQTNRSSTPIKQSPEPAIVQSKSYRVVDTGYGPLFSGPMALPLVQDEETAHGVMQERHNTSDTPLSEQGAPQQENRGSKFHNSAVLAYIVVFAVVFYITINVVIGAVMSQI